MKRLLALAMALVFVLGTVATASAVDVKQKGEFKVTFEWTDNNDFLDAEEDGESEDDFAAFERFRWYLDFVANENLKGSVAFEFGSANWGAPGVFDLSGDGVALKVKHAFVQFHWPETELGFRAGLQNVDLPAATFGSPVLDADMAAFVMDYPFSDQVHLFWYWARLADDNAVVDNGGAAGDSEMDEVDVFGANLYIDWDGFSFDPYAAFGIVGKDTVDGDVDSLVNPAFDGTNGDVDDHILAYFIGLAFELDMFDPFWFGLDFAYGATDAGDDDDDDGVDASRAGYYVAALLNYKMEMVTPGIYGWYSSGEDDDDDDDDDDGSDLFPSIDGTFGATTLGFDGTGLLNSGAIVDAGGGDGGTATGTWGVGIQFADFSFVEDLSHTLRVAYVAGTSDEDAGIDFDEEDSAVEVNFDHNYKIYENLSAIAELGAVFPELDDTEDEETAFRLGLGLKYKF